jgi:hypothetical protein
MKKTKKIDNSDNLAQYFIQYLCERYPGARHVRRCASWLGFILKGIERAGADYWLTNTRQIEFRGGTLRYPCRYRVRYVHKGVTLPRGGVEIVEMNGRKLGAFIASIGNLAEAEEFYLNFRNQIS